MDLPRIFKLHLVKKGASPITIKNYLSDFNHFWGWLILSLRNRGGKVNLPSQAIIKQIKPETIVSYKDFLLANKTPAKTINRRLSSLRRFGELCLNQGWLSLNPAKGITNVSLKETQDKTAILNHFRSVLVKERVSQLTIKNYLSDIRHFLAWVEIEV